MSQFEIKVLLGFVDDLDARCNKVITEFKSSNVPGIHHQIIFDGITFYVKKVCWFVPGNKVTVVVSK